MGLLGSNIISASLASWKERRIMKKHDKALTKKQLAAIQDNDISFIDIPELDDSFWKKMHNCPG
jgi:hypothetical protein